jgi:hypothetical protein
MKNVRDIFNSFGIVPEHYIVRISNAYTNCSDVDGIEKWLRKFEKIKKDLESSKLESQIRSHCFELEVVDSLRQYHSIYKLVYEPDPINSDGKNCDLKVCSKVGEYLIEFKSFNPDRSSRPLNSDFFPKHATVDLDESIYYDDFTIRSRLIDMAVDVEKKFANHEETDRTVLAVQTGFYLDWLRYFGFVHIYQLGLASDFDYLGEMSMHYINNKSIRYRGLINEFWSFHHTDKGITEVSLVEATRCEHQPIQLAL